MKKILLYALVLCMVLGFSGCGKKEKPPIPAKQSAEELMVYDLMETFYKDEANANCAVSDHAVAEDKMYGLMGIVQYTNTKGDSACYAFVTSENGSHPVTFGKGELIPARDSKLVYLGNGAASFLLENTETAEIFEYTVTYSESDGRVKIDADSKLLEE